MVSEGHPIQFQNARRQPKVASHADFSRAGNVDKGHRIKIAALEIRSFLAKQEALDSFTNGDAANGAALTETNVTPNEIGSVKMPNFPCANHCCREQRNFRGRGGGGVTMWVRHAARYIPGKNTATTLEREGENC